MSRAPLVRLQPLSKGDPEAVIRNFESGSAPATEQNVADYIKARARARFPRCSGTVLPRAGARRSRARARSPARRWCTWTGWMKTR